MSNEREAQADQPALADTLKLAQSQLRVLGFVALPSMSDSEATIHEHVMECIDAALSAPAAVQGEAVGTLSVQRYRGHLENTSFDYTGSLPDGTYSLYTTPQPTAPAAAEPAYMKPWTADEKAKLVDVLEEVLFKPNRAPAPQGEAVRYGGCPSCGRGDCLVRSCQPADMLKIVNDMAQSRPTPPPQAPAPVEAAQQAQVLSSREAMAVVLDADASRSDRFRGTSNWAALIARAVERAVLDKLATQQPQPAEQSSGNSGELAAQQAKDARRYRQLRDDMDLPYVNVWHTKDERSLEGADLDAHLDAVRAAQVQGEKP